MLKRMKRIGILALMLSGGALFLQPAVALAADHNRGHQTEVRRDDRGRRDARQYVARDEHRFVRREWVPAPRVYVTPAPNYYYSAPAPSCTYPYPY